MHSRNLEIIIFLPMFNVEKWIETTFYSIQNQTFKNFKAYFLDDCSSDNTVKKLRSLIGNDNRFHIIENSKRVRTMENLFVNITNLTKNCESNTILVNTDGDDWYANIFVLEKIYKAHLEGNLVTHGSHIRYPEFCLVDEGEYSTYVKDNNLYKRDRWRCTGTRSFRKFLWDSLKREELLDENGSFYEFTSDQALMYPILEKSQGKIKYFKECLHIYNRLNAINDDKVDRSKQLNTELKIRNITLQELNNILEISSGYQEKKLENKLKLYFDGNDGNFVIKFFKNYVNHVESTIENCDYIICGKLEPIAPDEKNHINEVLRSYNQSKKVIVFLVSDYEYELEIPNNVTLYRTSLRKKIIKSNERLLAYPWMHFPPEEFKELDLISKPIVGFCGTFNCDLISLRKETCSKFENNNFFQTNFLFREKFWGGKPHDPEVIEEYKNVALNSHFIICNRGCGNYAVRFYETLYLGRIPILVQDDMLLPFEDLIDWDKYIVRANSPEELPNKVIEFCKNNDIVKKQKECYELFKKYFSFEGFGIKIEEDLKNKIILMEHFYQSIGEDWFTYPNLYSRMVKEAKDGYKFVEVGAWKGRSSCFLAVEIHNSKKLISFDVVDTWLGSDEHIEFEVVKTNKLYKEFLENIKSVKHIINPIRMTSLEASKLYENDSLDFVFIDASHRYEDVKNDLEAWLPKIKEGGFLAGHDYGYWESVTNAVNDFFEEKKLNFQNIGESCFMYQKK
jgi:glycosyltransferase involved in cell wall biosynthesis